MQAIYAAIAEVVTRKERKAGSFIFKLKHFTHSSLARIAARNIGERLIVVYVIFQQSICTNRLRGGEAVDCYCLISKPFNGTGYIAVRVIRTDCLFRFRTAPDAVPDSQDEAV